MRAALEWSLSGGDPELGGQLASSLNRFWSVRGHFIDGRRWLERALATNSGPPPWLETKLLKVAAANTHDLGDFGRVRELTDKRLNSFAGVRGVAQALYSTGVVGGLGRPCWAGVPPGQYQLIQRASPKAARESPWAGVALAAVRRGGLERVSSGRRAWA